MGEPTDLSAYLGPAHLNAAQINQLQALESELGVLIVAIQPIVPLAHLSEDQVQKLQLIEKEMGVILLACRK